MKSSLFFFLKNGIEQTMISSIVVPIVVVSNENDVIILKITLYLETFKR